MPEVIGTVNTQKLSTSYSICSLPGVIGVYLSLGCRQECFRLGILHSTYGVNHIKNTVDGIIIYHIGIDILYIETHITHVIRHWIYVRY